MWVQLGFRMMALCCAVAVSMLAACGGTGSPPAQSPSIGEEQEGAGHYGESIATGANRLEDNQLRNQRVTRVEELLQGRVAGVQVTRLANGNYSVRVRGTNSILGNNEPLFVIDGMPINQYSLNGALAGINPADVARIEVLKDPSDTSMYGMRGANGVIVITTKRAR